MLLKEGLKDTLHGLLPKALAVLARELEGETPPFDCSKVGKAI